MLPAKDVHKKLGVGRGVRQRHEDNECEIWWCSQGLSGV